MGRLSGLLHVLQLLELTALSLNQSLSVLVNVQLGDDELGWVDVDWDGSTAGLLLGQLVDLDGELQSVDGGDLTLLALLGASDNQDLVVLSDRQGLDVVLGAQLLGQRSGHQDTTLRGWGGEVSLSGLSSVGGHVCRRVSKGVPHGKTTAAKVLLYVRSFGECQSVCWPARTHRNELVWGARTKMSPWIAAVGTRFVHTGEPSEILILLLLQPLQPGRWKPRFQPDFTSSTIQVPFCLCCSHIPRFAVILIACFHHIPRDCLAILLLPSYDCDPVNARLASWKFWPLRCVTFRRVRRVESLPGPGGAWRPRPRPGGWELRRRSTATQRLGVVCHREPAQSQSTLPNAICLGRSLRARNSRTTPPV